MKHLFFSILFMITVFSPLSGGNVHKIYFDGNMEVSGRKFALRDINPYLPEDWDNFNYVVLEYKISTAQRFQLGFTTAAGYNELRVMSYVPNAWNRLAIPLSYFTSMPDPALDLAATYNHARYTGWINLGGKRGPMHHVDSIGFRIRKPIGNPTLEIRNVYLSFNDPGDLYMEDKPAVDEFGQSNLVEYPDKIYSLDQLELQWRAEEDEKVSVKPYNYSVYGGYMQKRVKSTGYFRVARTDGRWWFIDPDGYLFLSVGVDCVRIGDGNDIRGYNYRAGMYKAILPDSVITATGAVDHRTGKPLYSFGLWNLYRRYGADYKRKALDMVIKRMDKWGLNTVANWSDEDVMRMNRKAFLFPLHDLGLSNDLMGLCDVYDPGFESRLTGSLKRQTSSLRDDPWLIGYFIGNEPAWLSHESRLCGIILKGGDRPIKAALKKYLSVNGDSPESRKAFIYDTFRRFIAVSDSVLKKCDPNHLNLGIRFGDPLTLDKRILKICGDVFDVFSFNCYMMKPGKEMLDRVRDVTGLPVIIGEYHFGTVDRGYAQSLWQVDNEEQRGVAYRYYTENAYSDPSLIGTAYFQWSDEALTGRGDGENYNCGLVDITDRPYKDQVGAMMETAKRLYKIHLGELAPYGIQPENCRGHEAIPDLWNK
ncbi:MAG: hypothetical protein LKI42_00285 [Bacteroidales bacterium]|jgi:hypothetical protein|nr:hypothetical protein [Bacteroidales bacterium]MCI1786245.1 hypothetical protein [Bacteroidales bacterium]